MKLYAMSYIPKYEAAEQDIAMDTLRNACPFLGIRALVTNDGLRMYCHLVGNDKEITRQMLEVWKTISENKLPMMAYCEPHTFVKNRSVLTVLFDTTKVASPCY